MSLLCVEDNAIARDILRTVLNSRYRNLVVHTAHKAEEGLELFRKHQHSIVITDISLSGADGVWLAESVRAEAPETVIIFITGGSDIEGLTSCQEADSCHILNKPLDIKVLFGVLDQYIDGQ